MNLSEALLSHSEIFKYINLAAEELNYKTYVIGGFVRDFILKRKGKEDIDVVCIGSGIDLAIRIAELCGKDKENVTVFKNFGTAMLHIGNCEVQFVGARKESYRLDSRKPIVEDGTLEDDQNRRDFTINALAISLNTEDWGNLLDPFNGLEDLKKRILRTPLDPEITFSDDPLRMMRAIRFASQLNFDIEAHTFAAIKNFKERIEIVSKERVTDELNKIILSEKPSYGFNLLFQAGLLHIIFPEMTDLYGTETINKKTHKDNFYHTLKVLDNISEMTEDLWLRWAAILHDIAKPATKRFDPKVGWTFHGHEDKGARMVPGIFRKMKLPLNEKMKFVQKLVRLHLRPIALVKSTITDSAIRRVLFEVGDDLESLMTLCRADITSKDGARVKKYLTNFDIVEKKMHLVEENDKVRNLKPVITGEIIMETFDLKPSREVGALKVFVREAILDGHIPNSFPIAYEYLIQKAKGMKIEPKKILTQEEFELILASKEAEEENN